MAAFFTCVTKNYGQVKILSLPVTKNVSDKINTKLTVFNFIWISRYIEMLLTGKQRYAVLTITSKQQSN